MAHLRAYIYLLIVFYSAINSAQELPPIQNYSAIEYNGHNQNWSITQTHDKTIFIANNKGLLEFNGARWKLYDSPNETIVRSVKAIDDKIYTGSHMEFGYWQRDSLKVLNYISLSKNINQQLIDDEQFWNIINVDHWVLFQSLNRIYLYNTVEKKFNIINSNSAIVKMYEANSGIYFQKLNDGLYKIENGKGFLISDTEVLKDNRIINVFDHHGALLVQTQNKGFYTLIDGAISKWDISANELLSKIDIYNSIQLKNGGFALGTISNGVIHLNDKGNFEFKIDQDNGLNNNTVLSLFEDVDANIWLGLDNGVSCVNQNSPYKSYHDYKGEIGSVYASILHEGYLYLGTNQGLFYKDIYSRKEFELIEGTKGQVWSLCKIDDTLFCGHDTGTFIIKNNKANKISNIQGTWGVKKIKDKDILLQGNYDGLYVLEKSSDSWKLRNKIKGFNISSRYFELIDDNEVFVSHEYKGIFRVKIDDGFQQALNIEKETVEKSLNASLCKYLEDVYYASKHGVFKYDKSSKAFAKDTILSKIYDNGYVSGKLIANNQARQLWAVSKSNLSYITPGKLTNVPKIHKIPLMNSLRESIVGYEDILQIDDNEYLLGTSSGYITIDVSKLEDKDFKVSINTIIKGSSKNNEIVHLVDQSLEGGFKSNENNIEISFNVAEYSKYKETHYQYKLKGIYDSWSGWSTKSIELFENLPHGDYEFLVRAKRGDKISENTASFSFNIDRPWYISNLMLSLYILSVILFSIFMHNVYKRYYKKQQEKLIESNERKLKLAQLESEQEIVKIKNEQLKNDIKSKSKELAASTMSVVKKNELLTQIKEKLAEVKEKDIVEPVLIIIDKSLNHSDNWELFKEAFNNADREFLTKLNDLHPNLSPNDIKLCAYLRLNLSSKEIAPLFNISARSVEIKRYRLRKKMNLTQKDNLVSYILDI